MNRLSTLKFALFWWITLIFFLMCCKMILFYFLNAGILLISLMHFKKNFVINFEMMNLSRLTWPKDCVWRGPLQEMKNSTLRHIGTHFWLLLITRQFALKLSGMTAEQWWLNSFEQRSRCYGEKLCLVGVLWTSTSFTHILQTCCRAQLWAVQVFNSLNSLSSQLNVRVCITETVCFVILILPTIDLRPNGRWLLLTSFSFSSIQQFGSQVS